jgi:hypothetical protein
VVVVGRRRMGRTVGRKNRLRTRVGVAVDGSEVGAKVGERVGLLVGEVDGERVGLLVGEVDGERVGLDDDEADDNVILRTIRPVESATNAKRPVGSMLTPVGFANLEFVPTPFVAPPTPARPATVITSPVEITT